MTKYGSESWVEKMIIRRSIRDFYRDKFFSDNGFSRRMKDPFDLAINPENQLSMVLCLFEKASDGLAGDNTSLGILKNIISSSMLGIGISPTAQALPLKLNKTTLSSLAQSHFTSLDSE